MKITKMKMYVGLASLLVAVTAFASVLSTAGTPADALTMENRRDCNYTDVIVNCGTLTTEELRYVYENNIDGAQGQENRGNRDIRAIFEHYGIARSDVFGNNVKKGRLNTDGTITVDGAIVANNAQSVYRAHPGADKTVKPVTIAGKTFYEGPVAGSYYKGADVFVFYRNGIFHAAVQASCGNPIVATNKVTPPPTPKPVYACNSLTATKMTDTRYKFTANASAKDGASVVDYNYTFSDGTTLKNQPASIEREFTKAATEKTITATVTANVKIASTGKIVVAEGSNCKATITIPALPKVSAKCENLKITNRASRTKFTFTATASAENVAIKSYTFTFGDGKTQTVTTPAKTATVTYEYANTDAAKKYTAKVAVNLENGTTATTSQNCEVAVDIPEKDKPAIDIVKTVNGKKHINTPVGTEFTYEIVVRNIGNVALKNAVVTDNAPREVTLLAADRGKINGNTWTYTIPELKPGTSQKFVIRAKYAKYAGGVHTNKVCVDTPTIPGGPDDCDEATTETNEPIKVCDLTDNTIKEIDRSEFDEKTMTTDLTKCDEMKVCIIKDKTVVTIKKHEFDETTMTVDLNECAETVPPELPQTGLDMFISGGLGLGSISAASYYWVGSRRNLLDALLKK